MCTDTVEIYGLLHNQSKMLGLDLSAGKVPQRVFTSRDIHPQKHSRPPLSRHHVMLCHQRQPKKSDPSSVGKVKFFSSLINTAFELIISHQIFESKNQRGSQDLQNK